MPSKSRWIVYGLSAGLGDSLDAWNVAQEGHSRFLVRKPLARQSWPIQGMRDNQIIQVGCILLPMMGARVIHLGGWYGVGRAHHVLYSCIHVSMPPPLPEDGRCVPR